MIAVAPRTGSYDVFSTSVSPVKSVGTCARAFDAAASGIPG
jgi:hypothetical protein